MEFKTFEGVDKNEISMIEAAHAILAERGDIMDFSDLVNQIQNYLEKADSEIRDILPQFYTDLNIDGSFISLGDNRWGLRSWYPIDSVDEEVTGIDDDEDGTVRRKKRKKVNAFMGADEDAIDYNDDDPEDSDIHDEDEEELYDEEEDETKEIKEYTTDLSEIGADNDVEEEDNGVEGLTIVDEDDLEDDLYEEDEEETHE
ncbi:MULTISPECIES: DNA-directed RNA polymerase subunit delta [Vagococcus]|uniref:Probable DNA-directed RNA polymerase subunit delta n=1 Tax=Vagococcus fluvialis bH819 TaxID=1255619 RepID=A0A1X6WQ78_9ENTE|nr:MULTISPECIES: DNA-directed RNA polymerase subunit delta [Vagococcus]SLM86501.1 DNA-directed RNA polymerase delta subunit [Vagococcus fluvialis bH819]HCM90708.1 DNA-directed RNA polymerase subunit delta [Vagococcus sp.]